MWYDAEKVDVIVDVPFSASYHCLAILLPTSTLF